MTLASWFAELAARTYHACSIPHGAHGQARRNANRPRSGSSSCAASLISWSQPQRPRVNLAAPYDAGRTAGTPGVRAIHIATREEANREPQGLVESSAASSIPSDSSNDAPTPRSCAARDRRQRATAAVATAQVRRGIGGPRCKRAFSRLLLRFLAARFMLNVLVQVVQLIYLVDIPWSNWALDHSDSHRASVTRRELTFIQSNVSFRRVVKELGACTFCPTSLTQLRPSNLRPFLSSCACGQRRGMPLPSRCRRRWRGPLEN
jgi:hypothetical protein